MQAEQFPGLVPPLSARKVPRKHLLQLVAADPVWNWPGPQSEQVELLAAGAWRPIGQSAQQQAGRYTCEPGRRINNALSTEERHVPLMPLFW